MARDQKDYFYRKAKSEGYRARSAFKLQQINKRFRLVRRGDSVLDLGAAPGGWLQVAKEISGGQVVGVDLQAIEPIDGVTTIKADITAPETLDLIREALGGEADVVICDAAPNLSGNWTLDHSRSIDLSSSALRVAKEVLNPGFFQPLGQLAHLRLVPRVVSQKNIVGEAISHALFPIFGSCMIAVATVRRPTTKSSPATMERSGSVIVERFICIVILALDKSYLRQ